MTNKLLTEQECYQATIGYAHRLGRKVSRGTHAGDKALCEAQDLKSRADMQREIGDWLTEYAIHGSQVALQHVIQDLTIHSSFSGMFKSGTFKEVKE